MASKAAPARQLSSWNDEKVTKERSWDSQYCTHMRTADTQLLL